MKYLNCAIVYCMFLKKLTETAESTESSPEIRALNKELLTTIQKESQEEVKIADEEAQRPAKSDSFTDAPSSSGHEEPPAKSLISELEDSKTLFDPEQKVNFGSFALLEKIGAGAFGSIFRVEHKATHEVFAMKAISKKYLFKTKQLKYAMTECQILKMMDHPFIIKMHYAFQTPKYLYFILDYCGGGDLSMHLNNKQLFKEEEARFYVAELVLAIEYLHAKNIVYRDLKPDNLLIGIVAAAKYRVGNDGHLKVSDFGLAKQMYSQQTPQSLSFCGSPAYLSPEMLLKKGAGKGVDIYGIGTILYEFLIGLPPYYDEDPKTMFTNITMAKLKIPGYVSPKARSVLKVPR